MAFGIDVGGTTIKYGVVSDAGQILHKGSVPTPATEGPDAVVRAIAQAAHDLGTRHQALGTPPPGTRHQALGTPPPGTRHQALGTSIGIAFPSVVHRGITYNCPNIPGFHEFDLQGALERALPGSRVVIENDANAAAIAEARLGAGRDHPDFLYVTLGTGVGGGVVNGDAGEIGHIIVSSEQRVASSEQRVASSELPSYRQGVLEEIVGAAAIVRRYNQALGTRHQAPGTVADINTSAINGEPLAQQILEETGYWLGIGLCSALTTLGLRVVVVGGGVSMSDIILEGALDTIRERAIPSIAENIVLKRAHFLNDTGIVGAALLGARGHGG